MGGEKVCLTRHTNLPTILVCTSVYPNNHLSNVLTDEDHYSIQLYRAWCVISTPFPFHFLVNLHFNLVISLLSITAL